MATNWQEMTCSTRGWLTGAVGGVVALVVLLLVRFAFLEALLLAILLGAAIGGGRIWATCHPEGEEETRAAPATTPDPGAGMAGTADGTAPRTAQPHSGDMPPKAPDPAEASPAAAAAPAPSSSSSPSAPSSSPATAEAEEARPAALDAPRGGSADDLKRIKGVGPKLEEALNDHGIYHFDQIAGWSEAELAWADANLPGVSGRASRDDWVAQSRDLAKREGA